MTQTNLGPRQQQLLKLVVEKYILDGQPVGSTALVRDSGLQLSSASVRNVMAELESQGLLTSPHTSAGRVPTEKGYRIFVDTLVNIQPLETQLVDQLAQQFGANQITQPGYDQVIQQASALLSEVTQLAGLVMLPRRQLHSLRHIEFVRLSERRVLTILVLNEQEVQNRILQTAREYSDIELETAANYLNAHFAGQDLQIVRHQLNSEINQLGSEFNTLLQSFQELTAAMLADVNQSQDVVVEGQTNLMSFQELADVDQLRLVFQALNEKRDLLDLMDRCLQAESLQIFIGREAGSDVLSQCSVITSPYGQDGETMGVLGVIGPTRMAYDKVIPIVDITAKLVGAALGGATIK